MKPTFFLLAVLLHLALLSRGNDGAFLVNGNQLIPMYETDITVQKEILTIKRINERQAQITVYYEFFNPKVEKAMEVGFEAYSPSGDADHSPDEGGQPHIYHFTVNLNGAVVPWKVAMVKDSNYYQQGKYKALTYAQASKLDADETADFFYAYHFRAVFRKGVNIVQHTYIVDLSSSVAAAYSLNYILTAAKRWGNRQIDDFTLQIDMGEYQDLSIDETFFQHPAEWTMTGLGTRIERKMDYGGEKSPLVAQFFIHKGTLVFKKTNFRPDGELDLSGPNAYAYYTRSLQKHPGYDTGGPVKFDYRLDDLPFSVDSRFDPSDGADELSKRIVRNLPFARRGYVFKSADIQAYYFRQPWYVPDSSYVPVLSGLTSLEQKCLAGKN